MGAPELGGPGYGKGWEVAEEPGFLLLGAGGIRVRPEVRGCSCLSVAVGSHLASPGQGQRSQQETAAASRCRGACSCARGAHRGAINAGFGDPVVALSVYA